MTGRPTDPRADPQRRDRTTGWVYLIQSIVMPPAADIGKIAPRRQDGFIGSGFSGSNSDRAWNARPANLIQTMLMRDRFFVGWKFRYDGGHAILRADGNTMEFYAEDGKLLRSVTVETKKEAAA